VFNRRVSVLVGSFGSGKSELALQAALASAEATRRTALLDLDLVKPFLRARTAREWLESRGIEVVAPSGENAFADLPILLPRVRGLLRDEQVHVLADVGGDEAGARVLGSLGDALPLDADLLLVLNFRRPFAETVEQVLALADRIARAARRGVTGLISNTHLKHETTPEVVVRGYEQAREVATRLGVPVVAVPVQEELAARMDPTAFDGLLVPFQRLLTLPFEEGLKVRRSGPLFVLN